MAIASIVAVSALIISCWTQAGGGLVNETDMNFLGTYEIVEGTRTPPPYGAIVDHCTAGLMADNPDSAKAQLLAWRSLARTKMKKHESALEDAEAAIAIRHEYGLARMAKAHALFRLGRVKEALVEVDNVSSEDNNYIDASIFRALLLVESGRHNDAFAAADRIGKHHDMSFLVRALAFIRTGQGLQALEACEEYLAMHRVGPVDLPDLPFALKGEALRTQARLDESRDAFLAGLAVRSDSVACLQGLVVCSLADGATAMQNIILNSLSESSRTAEVSCGWAPR